jgi:endoglucanase
MGRGLNVKAFRLNGAPGWGATYDSRYADVIADAGFDSVRVWAFVQNESGGMRNFGSDPNNTLVPEFFSELDQRVNDFLDRDLVVILNFFELGGFETGSNEYKTIFVNLWTQIAEHYQGTSDRLVFQPINESHDGLDEVLSDWYLAFTEAVRRTNPTRVILYSPPNGGRDRCSTSRSQRQRASTTWEGCIRTSRSATRTRGGAVAPRAFTGRGRKRTGVR